MFHEDRKFWLSNRISFVSYLSNLPSGQIWLGLLGFHGISTIKGYLMPNSVFRYILNICLVNTICRCTQLNDPTVLFLTIQVSIGHLFAHSLIDKEFYLIHRSDPIRCYHSRPDWSWVRWK